LAKLFPPFAAKLLQLHQQLRESSLEWSCVAGDCLVIARQLEETGICGERWLEKTGDVMDFTWVSLVAQFLKTDSGLKARNGWNIGIQGNQGWDLRQQRL